MATKRIGNITVNVPDATDAETQIYNAIGRSAGSLGGNTTTSSKYATTSVSPDANDNFLVSTLKDFGNALGTTGAAISNTIRSGNDTIGIKGAETTTTESQLKSNREKLNSIAQEYGYASYKDALGDTNASAEMMSRLQQQAADNSSAMNTKAAEFKDYAQNNEASKLINQDPLKYGGSAINTLSRAADIMLPGAGVAMNAIQGGLEGFADEMKYGERNQNFNEEGNVWALFNPENFNTENAITRAGIGAATGAATGALNKSINNAIANNASNSVLKGGNSFTKALNKFDNTLNKSTAGIAGAAARGAATGAVGGGVGAGLSSALNGADIGTGISNALQGALTGAGQGAAMGGAFGAINAGANAAKNLKAGKTDTAQTAQTQQATATEPVEVEGKDITGAFAMNETPIEKTNKVQNLGKQIKNVSESIKYLDLYGNLDASTADRAVKTQAPQNLAKLGVKPQDYAEYAKTSNYVNKVVSDLADASDVKVNVPDLADKLSLSKSNAALSDTATKKYNEIVSQIVADGDSPAEYSASYLLEKSREIGDRAAKISASKDDTKPLRTALNEAKWTLRDIANNALEESGITGDLTTDNIAKGLKQLGANEDVIDYYTQATADGKAPTAADFIKRSSLFEQARDMGTQYQREKFTRSASKEPTTMTTQAAKAAGINQLLNVVLQNTVSPVVGGAAKAAGGLIEGAGTLGSKIGKATSAISTPAPTDISTRVFNAIGRETGQSAANDYIGAAAQETAQALSQPQYSTLEELAGNTSTSNISNLSSTGTTGTTGTSNLYTTTGTAATQTGKASSIFGNTGNSQLDLLASAMDIAVGNNDATAFGQLYEMYMEMASNVSSKSSDTGVSSWSAAAKSDLTEALNGLDQIDALEEAYNAAGGGQGWLTGGIANITSGIGDMNTAGKAYNQYAESVGTALVKNLVNLGATESDVQRYVNYIPSLSDTQEAASMKLEQLRKLYQDTINNLYKVNGQ